MIIAKAGSSTEMFQFCFLVSLCNIFIYFSKSDRLQQEIYSASCVEPELDQEGMGMFYLNSGCQKQH